MPFPFAARMPCSLLFSTLLNLHEEQAGLLSALYNFPLVSRSGSLCGRLAGFPGILSRVFISRGARVHAGLTLSAFTSSSHSFQCFTVRGYYLKRFQVARQSLVRVVASFERLPDKKQSRVTHGISRYPLRTYAECVPRERIVTAAHTSYYSGTLRDRGRVALHVLSARDLG